VMFSFMTHFGFVVYLENSDWPIDQGIATVPDDVLELVMNEPPPPEPEPEAVDPNANANAPAEDEAPAKQAKQADKPEQAKQGEKAAGDSQSAEEKAAAQAEATARMAEEAASAAEALLLGALGSEGGGALADVLAGGAVTGNAEDVLAQAAGVGVASGSTGGTLRARAGGSSGARVGGLGSLTTAGGGGKLEGGTALEEKAPRGNIKVDSGEDIGGTGEFDAKLVTAEVRKRIGAIKACYEQQLRRNPGLQGKVTVEFTIEQSGSISKATATTNTTNDPQVATCVVDAVKRFRFNPGPEGGSVTYSYPFVFSPQG
jgi:TonB family protein